MPQSLRLAVPAPLDLSPEDRVTLVETDAPEFAARLTVATGRLPVLAAGTVLTPADGAMPRLQIVGSGRRPGRELSPAGRLLFAKALAAGRLSVGETAFVPEKAGLALAWITLSDKGSLGLRDDVAGPAIAETCAAALSLCLTQGHIIPDDPGTLKALLTDLALAQGFDLIITTGGTGLAPRDTTPEATLAVIEKRLPGFETAMLTASLAKTRHAMISRAVVGTLGQSLIVNLPGSPKAVRETLAAIIGAIPHGLDKLRGDPSDCAQA